MLFPILAVIFLFLHLVFAFGKAKDDNEYFRAKSHASAPVIGISLAATILGASGVMGTISWGSTYGIAGSLWLISGVIGLLILWALFPRISEKKAFTLLGLCPQSNGNWSQKLFALVIIPAWTAIAAAQFKALALLLTPWFNISPLLLLLILAAVISLYLVRGGQLAVFKSDYFQFFIIAMGLLLGFSLLVVSGKIQSPATLRPITADYSPLVFGSVILTYIIGPDIHSRLLAAPDAAIGKKAILIAAFLVLIFAVILALIGLSGALWLEKSGDQIITLMIAKSGIWGIFINLALISVLLSSL
ncbi:MAG: sodium:solute symporter family transporter, partial [Myxococcota bacterium]